MSACAAAAAPMGCVRRVRRGNRNFSDKLPPRGHTLQRLYWRCVVATVRNGVHHKAIGANLPLRPACRHCKRKTTAAAAALRGQLRRLCSRWGGGSSGGAAIAIVVEFAAEEGDGGDRIGAGGRSSRRGLASPAVLITATTANVLPQGLAQREDARIVGEGRV